jgi:hypothetical protein
MDQPVSFQHGYLDQHAHPGVQPAFAVDLPAHAHFMDQPVSFFLSGPACCLVTLSTTSLLPLWTSLLSLGTSLFQSSFLDQPAHLDQPSLFRRGAACSFMYQPVSVFFMDQPAHLDQPAHHDVDHPAEVVDQPVSVPCACSACTSCVPHRSRYGPACFSPAWSP